MAKQKVNVKEVLNCIQKHFQLGEPFNSKQLKDAYMDENLNVTYFMSIIVEKGDAVQIKRGLWSLPGGERNVSNIKTLYISKAEKRILDAILKMDLKSENGISRFGMNKLSEILTEEESVLLPDLLPKLKSVGILSCVGTGTQGRILEIKDDLFLEYVTDPDVVKEISLTDLEIDQKIKRFLSEEDRKRNRSLEISERLESVEGELLKVLTQIETLETNKELIEKEIKSLRQDLSRLQNTNDDVERQFIDLMAGMDPERRREIFKKILVK